MSEKRFRIVHLNLKRLDRCDIQDTAQEIPTFYNDLGYRESVEPVCDLKMFLLQNKGIIGKQNLLQELRHLQLKILVKHIKYLTDVMNAIFLETMVFVDTVNSH